MLGKGSFASVYKVRHHDLGYVRAIKVSNDLVTEENDRAYQTFLNECRVLLKIGNGCHPNIIRIYRPRLIANKAIVEMDYVDGESLAAYVGRKRFIDYKEFKRFALEIVSAMAYCHVDLYKFLMDPDSDNLEPNPKDGSKYIISPKKELELIHKYGVNHNDLHSNNIMRRHYDGGFMLLDFGLAIQDDHCVKSSSRGDGAYEYCSPEKLEEKKDISSASDVYSLGILLYEMLAGRVPFVLNTKDVPLEQARYQVYNAHLQQTPPPIIDFRCEAFCAVNPGNTYVRDYPEAIDRIVAKCLMKNPDDRYPNAKYLLEDLKAVFEAENSYTPPIDVPVSNPNTTHSSTESKDLEIEELKSRLRQASANYEELRKAFVESKNQIEVLRQELEQQSKSTPDIPPIVDMSEQSIGVQRGDVGSKGLWAASLIFAVLSSIILFVLWTSTEYFRSLDSLNDVAALGAELLSVALLVSIGLKRRMAVVQTAFAIFTSTIASAFALMTTFGSISYAVGLISCLSLLFLILYVLRPNGRGNA